jgi:hypothetical protein
MIKEILVSGYLASAMACVIIDKGPLTIDTLSPGVVEYYYGDLRIDTWQEVDIEDKVNMPSVLKKDTSYQWKLNKNFENNWKEGESIFLVDVVDVKQYHQEPDTLEGEFVVFNQGPNYEVFYRATEYSWEGERGKVVDFIDTIYGDWCGGLAPQVTQSPLIYWNNNFTNPDDYNPTKGYKTFREEGELRVENNQNQPYVSISLDSSFALHRGEVTPINPSNKSVGNQYQAYDSKGVLLGQFDEKGKKAIELENRSEKIFFRRD